jgi:HEAT repeat protein
MNMRSSAFAFLAVACLGFSSHPAWAHGGGYSGGSYGGPGDVTPPGSSGSTPGGSGPSTPGPSGPSTPGPSGPATPGAGGPAGPSTPGGSPSSGGGPSTGGGDAPLDLTRWQYWWELNKEPYLDLKRNLYERRVATGSDEWFSTGRRVAAQDTLRPTPERINAAVVPALFAALDRSQSNDVITGALIALAKIGDQADETGHSRFARRIATFLTHANQEVAETSALALGILGDENEAELLMALLRDDRSGLRTLGVHFVAAVPERTRAFAAYALGLLGEHASQPTARAIVEALSKPLVDGGRSFAKRDIPVACALALGLVRLPPAESEAELTPEAGRLLVREDQIAWLLERFRDRRAWSLIRAQAPRSLALLSADLETTSPARVSVVEALLASLDSRPADDAYVQQSCVLALGMLGDCDGDKLDAQIRTGLLRAYADCADQQVKRFALIALGQVAGRAGSGAGEPLAGLNGKKDDPRGFLLNRLQKGQSNERCWAALALGVLERALADQKLATSSDARGALRAALGDASSAHEVGAYAIALGIIRDAAAGDVLLAKLNKVGDPDACGYVALALGMIGDARSTQVIQTIVTKSKYQPDLLRSAATGLGLLGNREVGQSLIDMLAGASALSSQAAIASALGTIGDARSLDPLLTMLADEGKTERARGFAAAALGIVADKEPHPWVSRLSIGTNYRASSETLMSPDGGTGVLQIL